LGIPESNVYFPNWRADDPARECTYYEAFLSHVKRTVQLLGIGPNGHIGFCEPGTPFSTRTHVVPLAERTRIANSPFFMSDQAKRILKVAREEDPYEKLEHWTDGDKGYFYDEVLSRVPTHAITMGIATILEAESLLMLALGSSKTCALFKVLFHSPNTKTPASALRFHPDATIIADLDAVAFPSGKQNEGVYEI
jgi:glucosamine-6-phosphate deaminase